VISQTVLVATEGFAEGLDARRCAAAIGRGLRAADARLEIDLCPLEGLAPGLAGIKESLAAVGFDVRMRTARAVVLGARRLDEATLVGGAVFEIATRARQSGVPAYAVTAENALDLFDARIMDLQVVLRARDTRALRRAGERLASLL
jgi:glycerate kinase